MLKMNSEGNECFVVGGGPCVSGKTELWRCCGDVAIDGQVDVAVDMHLPFWENPPPPAVRLRVF